MSVNFFTYYNDSRPHPQLSSSNSSYPFELYCFTYKPGYLIFTTYTVTNLLLLPLFILILYHGLQRWQHQSSSSTATTTSHADSFTYHLVTMELINIFGSVLGCCGIYKDDFQMLIVWFYVFCFNWCGELFFHLLTCVEHYLAVVHPITYLSLKKERWIRIRNIIIGCIWLFCIGGPYLTIIGNTYIIVDLCLLIISIVIISFCSLSVLCVLIRPGPGKQSKDRERVDQSKQRAFYTIMAILGMLWLRFLWNVVGGVESLLYGLINRCVLVMCVIWINLSSSLVLPLLFLQRAGMLATCMNNIRGLKN